MISFNAIRPVFVLIVLTVESIIVNAVASAAFPNVATPLIPKNAVNLADCGGGGDGRTLNTAAFEKACSVLAAKGGGELIVPPGIWLTGPIKLRSNINLHVERGALIQFSGDFKLYPLTVIDLKGEKEVDSTSPISAEIAIVAPGAIAWAHSTSKAVSKAQPLLLFRGLPWG